tara:strand:+ start:2080 stop:2844 length:765 start_codon:yes stop_codon:yes gene_type:complete
MTKAAYELTERLLKQISKIDAALAAKQITPESADILRRQAAAQSQAAFDAAKAAEAAEAGRPLTKIAGVKVPEGGARAKALTGAALVGGGTVGLGLPIGNALVDRLTTPPKSTDPKASYTPSIRTQADIRSDVATRNAFRELGNALLVNPTRLGQMLLNNFLENDIPLKEYYEMEDPTQILTEDQTRTQDAAEEYGKREVVLETTKQTGPVTQEQVKADSAVMQRALELLQQRSPFNSGVPTQTRTQTTAPYQY